MPVLESITLYNASKQVLHISLRPPKGDFYLTEQQVAIVPGTTATVPRDHINVGQIQGLRTKRLLRVVGGKLD